MAIPTVDWSPAQNLVTQQRNDFQNLLNTQKNEQQGLFNQYTSTSQAQPKLVDVLNTAQQNAGIGGLQQGINLFNTQSQDVKGMIDRLGENTKARTSGTNANQAYLDRLRAAEGGGLNTQLSRLTEGLGNVTSAYNTANSNTATLLGATQADQDTALKPLELQINAVSDRFAREITGFTTTRQNELDVLLTKIKSDQQLKLEEWSRAQQLASEEKQYQRQRSLLAAEQNQRQSAIDTLTGKAGNKVVGGYAAKGNGGVAFTDQGGNPISAAKFAQINSIGMGDLLYRMGQSGDKYAAKVYNDMKSIVPYANSESAMQGWKKQYNPIFWGT